LILNALGGVTLTRPGLPQRQQQLERRAGARLAPDGQLAAVLACDRPRDRQPRSGTRARGERFGLLL
jgi:hypothetical protein